MLKRQAWIYDLFHRSNVYFLSKPNDIMIVLKAFDCTRTCRCSLLEVIYKGRVYQLYRPLTSEFNVLGTFESCYDI